MVDDLVNATFTNWAEISSDSSSDYGVTDDDSTPGDHGASDTGPGDTSTGGDPSIDHDDIDHDDSAYDDATEDEDDSDPASIYAASTTPVTLQTFTATMNGDQVSIYFSTSTEESNIGFHVYGRKDRNSRWVRLNGEIQIPATPAALTVCWLMRAVRSNSLCRTSMPSVRKRHTDRSRPARFMAETRTTLVNPLLKIPMTSRLKTTWNRWPRPRRTLLTFESGKRASSR